MTEIDPAFAGGSCELPSQALAPTRHALRVTDTLQSSSSNIEIAAHL
jgi:hypothetical protein